MAKKLHNFETDTVEEVDTDFWEADDFRPYIPANEHAQGVFDKHLNEGKPPEEAYQETVIEVLRRID